MIKKINIALALVFVVLFAFKFLLDAATAAKARKRRAAVTAAVASSASDLAPHIYFSAWPPHFSPNAVTRHNGFCLDIIREVFPNAVFDDSKDTTKLETVLELLRTDPDAVIAEYGDLPELEGFPTASEQMAWMALCVYLPRTNPWQYAGPESLDQLRLGWTADYNDSPVLRAFAEKWKDTPGKAVVYNPPRHVGDFYWERITGGEIDGFVSTVGEAEISRLDNDSKSFVRYRRSKPIDVVTLRFRASSVDLERSQRICDAFDEGVHRLYRDGTIQRLAEYYQRELSDMGLEAVKIPVECYDEDR